MIFTATNLSRSQTTSQMFKDNGAENMAPCPVGEARVTLMRARVTEAVVVAYSFLWAAVAAYLLGQDVPLGKACNALDKTVTTKWLVNIPPILVTFLGKTGDDKKEKLTDMGFQPQSQNKYQFFKGPASAKNVHDLLGLGAQADAYSVYGTVNINGYLTLVTMNRVLHAIYGFISKRSTSNDLYSSRL